MKGNRPQGTAGFTLMEVLVAITVTGLMVSVFTAAFLHLTRVQQNLSGRITALIIGEGKLAELEQGSELYSSDEFPEPYRNFKWQATEESISSGKLITLTVEWRDKDAVTRRTVLTGYRSSE